MNNFDVEKFLEEFELNDKNSLFNFKNKEKKIEEIFLNGKKYKKFINEYWTAKRRKSNSLHEISYRACFKPELPNFFIKLFSKEKDIVYDPFSGRGTTVLEAALLNRNIISNDINPLSTILAKSRFFIPKISELSERTDNILKKNDEELKSDIDLSMFYHPQTEKEILQIRSYLQKRKESSQEDELDLWIRMVSTNRLTGHSTGFFSVYTLPPNQAVSPERQIKINQKRNQKPEYRNVKKIILKKTKTLIKNLTEDEKKRLRETEKNSRFLNKSAHDTQEIESESVQLLITSPPFLDIVQYSKDNWLRCWFNNIDAKEIEKRITMSKKVEDWTGVMQKVFGEFYRIIKHKGWVVFEVGEIKKGTINLEEFVVPIGERNGFECKAILINKQEFTKTANIWGIKNNGKGTNSNRIIIFYKK